MSSSNQVVYDVLLNYSKIQLNDEERNFLKLALSQIKNHDLLLNRGLASHLGPLLHKTISSVNHSLPPKVVSTFASSYHQVLMRNIRIYEVFKEVLKHLNESSIDCIPLKGIYLAETVYQDLGLRHLSDIDLLVHERDAESVRLLMQANGWEVKHAELRSEFEQAQFTPAHPFSFLKAGVIIELHIRLFNLNQGLKISENTLWNHTHEEPFCDGKIRQLSSEMLLVYLCMHLHKHLLGRECKMVSFCDIRELFTIRKDQFDWAICEQLCNEFECRHEVAEVLYICQTYWAVDIPSHFLAEIKPVPLAERRFKQFMTGEAYSQAPKAENVVTKSLENLNSLDGISAKTRYLAGLFFPKPDFILRYFQLKPGTFLLPWYVLRIFILSGKLLLAMLNKVRNLFREV